MPNAHDAMQPTHRHLAAAPRAGPPKVRRKPYMVPCTPDLLFDMDYRPVLGLAGYVEPVSEALRHADPGGINIWGEATVLNGETAFRARNKIVGQGLRHIFHRTVKGLTCTGGSHTSSSVAGTFATNDLTNSRIMLGEGNSATAYGTSALTATALSSIQPSTTLMTAVTEPNDGNGNPRQQATFSAVWNSLLLPEVTLNEIGIFGLLTATDVLNETPQTNSANSVGNQSSLAMFARLAASEGDFTAVVIDADAPLEVRYTLRLAFVP